MSETYVDATDESALSLFARNISGEVVMLNLLRFRAVADYADFPDLAPERAISGREAYQRYIDHTRPFLLQSGGDIEFLGEGGKFFVGPQDEHWDLLMLIRQDSLQSFVAFATNEAYVAGVGHRTAALEDSRLLPLERYKGHNITGQR
ncbi:DUF1330 domain-containing protein [Congregibacter sp.]|jgi:uncharacterized protein (DUF1330 family)|uniref:DUF1330 domain-containing protein n=1 Tax=Congregibacter sp. TaxID=2744308 RepID=UPI0039E59728